MRCVSHGTSQSSEYDEISGVFVFLFAYFSATVKCNIHFIYYFFFLRGGKVRLHGKLWLKEFCLASGEISFKSISEMKSYEEDKIISQSLQSPRRCNRAFKQSIMQLSLDAR